MFISKRGLSKIYQNVGREEQKKIVAIEKILDGYVIEERIKEVPKGKVKEVSALLKVRNIPASVIAELRSYEKSCGATVFVSSHEEDVKMNKFK